MDFKHGSYDAGKRVVLPGLGVECDLLHVQHVAWFADVLSCCGAWGSPGSTRVQAAQ